MISSCGEVHEFYTANITFVLNAVCSNDLWALMLPQVFKWPTSLRNFIDIFDWDIVMLDEFDQNLLNSQFDFCNGLLPCKLSVQGNGKSVLKQQQGGAISCRDSMLCLGISFNSVHVVCSGKPSDFSVLVIQGASLVVTNSSFTTCSSKVDGGVIQAFGGASVTVKNSIFTSSYAEGGGGAISLVGGNLKLLNTAFENCSSRLGGGCIFAARFECYGSTNSMDSKIGIEFCNFQGGKTKESGGAIAVNGQGSSLIVESCVFRFCSAVMSGGAISSSDSAVLSVSNSTFLDNQAQNSGGAVQVVDSIGHIVLRACTFTSNRAFGAGGGAIYLKDSRTTLEGVTGTNNSAVRGGGGILFWQGSSIPELRNQSESLQVQTSNDQTMFKIEDFDLSETTEVDFQVEASKDAFIELTLSDSRSFFVVIGGMENSRSYFMQELQGPSIAEYFGRVLSPSEFKGFLLTWNNPGVLQLFRRTEAGILDLLCESPLQEVFVVQSMSVATGSGSEGRWRILKSFRPSPLSDLNTSLCGQSNYAVYGPCLSTPYDSLALQGLPSNSSPLFPGIPYTLTVIKKDFYNQTVAADSSSILQLNTAFKGMLISDPFVTVLGTTVARLDHGSAEFQIKLKPSFSNVQSNLGITELTSEPNIYFTGQDSALAPTMMQSSVFPVKIAAGFNICPKGYVLNFDSPNFDGPAQCQWCSAGKYSVSPLASKHGLSPSYNPECLNCPAGGNCLEGGYKVQFLDGEWWKLDTDQFRLLQCPNGTQLINSTDGNSKGIYSHDVQRCQPCLKTEYIVNPSEECQACPPGLKCVGTGAVSPAVNGSTWVLNGSIYRLIGCPAGYSVSSVGVLGAFDATAQQCSPCLKGEECLSAPCTSCSPCKPGFYKDTISSDPCSPCVENTYSEKFGGQDLSSCLSCPKNAGTFGKSGQSLFASCLCIQGYYMDPISPRNVKTCLVCPAGAFCLNGQPPVFGTPVMVSLSLDGVSAFEVCCNPSKASTISKFLAGSLGVDDTAVSLPASFCQDQVNIRCSSNARRLLADLLLLNFTVVSENPKAIAKALQNSDIAIGVGALANVSVGYVSVHDAMPETAALKAAGWVYGPMDSSGFFHLLGCASGFLLVNDSISTQTCFECLAGTYSMDFMDGCSSLANCRSGRSCNKCPAGASCSGRNNFIPNLATSIWKEEFYPELANTIMKLMSCPEGT
jgi:predicted outer membrane repeat protein